MIRLFSAGLTVMIATSPALAQDHGEIDHGAMDHRQPAGPPNAADAIWGADAMRPAREALYREHGNMPLFWFQGDRLEYRAP